MAIPVSNIISAALLVGGVAVMLVAHILVIFWALRRGLGSRRAVDVERAEDGGGAGLTAVELGALPCYGYRQADDDGSSGAGAADCAVCLEAFEVGDRCRRLPRCGHGFHEPCVDSWLRKSRVCPVCRADVVGRLSPRKGEQAGAASAATQVEVVARNSPTPLPVPEDS